MSISSTTTLQEFSGDGSTDEFNFSNIIYFEGESSTVLKVYIDDVVQSSGFSITENSATDGLVDGGTLTFTSAPADETTIKIQRETARTQPTDFGSSYSQDSIEDAHDRAVMILQELDEQGVDASSPSSSSSSTADAVFLTWATATDYVENQVVVVQGEGNFYEDSVFRATSDHTSNSFATDFGNGLWEKIIVKGLKGDTGATGPQGPKGDDGDQGPQGASGADGNDGIFSEIASQGEAETGTNNTKGMSPLRVAQAIADQVPDLSVVTTLQSDVSTAETDISNLETRTSNLEAASGLFSITGRQRLNNNESSARDLDAASGQNGSGNALKLDASSGRSARMEIEWYRKDDAETRFGVTQLRMIYNETNDTWYLGEETSAILDGAPSGITFAVDQTGDVGQITYVTDNMSGGNYSDDSYIIWRLVEITRN